MDNERIVELVKEALVAAGSTFRQDKKDAYRRAIYTEENERAKWVMRMILDNAEAAEIGRAHV